MKNEYILQSIKHFKHAAHVSYQKHILYKNI